VERLGPIVQGAGSFIALLTGVTAAAVLWDDAMSAEPLNLVLEHLRAMRADLSEIRDAQREHGHRLYRMETDLTGLRRDQANDAEGVAHVNARLDRLREDVDRIRRRLDLQD
jgi:chromosome segregation ATPase